MFERYTEKSRRVIFFARYEAAQTGSPYIETAHLLLGMLREGAPLFHQLGIKAVEPIAEECRKAFGSPAHKISTSVDLPLSNANKRVLAYAAEEAERLQSKWIGLQHLTLGMLREGDTTSEILSRHGITLDKLRSVAGFEGPARITAVAPYPTFTIEFVCGNKPIGKTVALMPCPIAGETVVFHDSGKPRWFKVVDVTHSYEANKSGDDDEFNLLRIVVTLEPKAEPTAE